MKINQIHINHCPFARVIPKKDLSYYIFWTVSYITAPILVPIKIILFILFLGLIQIFATLLSRELNVNKPLSDIRRSFIKKLAICSAKCLLPCLGYLPTKEVDVHLKPDIDTAYVAISNHVNSLDSFHFIANGFPSFAAKEEMKKYPVIGYMCWLMQSVFIPRTGKAAAERVAAQITRRIKDHFADSGLPRKFPMLMMFPEGTTVNQTALLPFKRGAFIAGKPVSMCSIQYSRFADSSDASMSLLKSQLLNIIMICNRATITYYGDYYPNSEEQTSPELYAENVRNFYAEQTGWQKCDYQRCDKFWFMGARIDYNSCTDLWKKDFSEDVRAENGWCVKCLE